MGIGRLMVNGQKEDGVTYAQAMEIFARYFSSEHPQAAPTIATQMSIPYETACRVLDGKTWPAAREYWINKVMP